jgi:hypothetical protein
MTVIQIKVKLLQTHGQKMHDITDVKIKYPVVLIFHSQDSFYIIF